MLPVQQSNLSPPIALQPPRSSRGALGVWTQLLQAVQKLSHDPLTLAEFKKTYDVAFGGLGDLEVAIRQNPEFLSGDRAPADLYAQFVRLVMRSTNAANLFWMTLQALQRDESARTAEVARGLLSGPGSLVVVASDLAREYKSYSAALQDVETRRKESFAEFRDAGAGLLQHAGAIANSPPEDLAYLPSAMRVAGWNIDTELEKMNIAASKVAIGAVLANLIAAANSVAEGWGTIAKSINDLLDQATDDELASSTYFEDVIHIQTAISEWKSLAEEGTRYIENVFVSA